MPQEIFSGIDYGFTWTNDWYSWDAMAGNKAAGMRIVVGAANPPQPYAPSLELLGMAT